MPIRKPATPFRTAGMRDSGFIIKSLSLRLIKVLVTGIHEDSYPDFYLRKKPLMNWSAMLPVYWLYAVYYYNRPKCHRVVDYGYHLEDVS